MRTLQDPNNPEFRRLAQAAAMGILPMYLKMLERDMYALGYKGAADTEELRMLLGALGEIGNTYATEARLFEQSRKAWADGLAQALTVADMQGKNRDEAIAEYIRAQGPEPKDPPQYDEVTRRILNDAYGMTPEEYQRAVRGIFQRRHPDIDRTPTPETTTPPRPLILLEVQYGCLNRHQRNRLYDSLWKLQEEEHSHRILSEQLLLVYVLAINCQRHLYSNLTIL